MRLTYLMLNACHNKFNLVLIFVLIVSTATSSANRHSRLDSINQNVNKQKNFTAANSLGDSPTYNILTQQQQQQQQQQQHKHKRGDEVSSNDKISSLKDKNLTKTKLDSVHKQSNIGANSKRHMEKLIMAQAADKVPFIIEPNPSDVESKTQAKQLPSTQSDTKLKGNERLLEKDKQTKTDFKHDEVEAKFADKSSENNASDSNEIRNIEECATELIGFEIITGYVFSAPEKLSSALPGTLMLTYCLDACRKDVTCHAVNYETGLCVLFSANADELPGALAKSQFPVFTLYAQKSCIRKRPCIRAWYIDRVQGYKLSGYVKRELNVESRQQCFESCLSEMEFSCRSANYYRNTKTCELSEMDRITLTGIGAFQQHIEVDYLENNCVDEPNKLCEFKRLPGRILKTVDAVYQDIGSIVECRDLCLNSPYRCHSYDYGDTGDMVCRLSHHSRITLSDVQEPYLEVAEATTYELSSCYNVTIECSANDMIARIRTSKLFDGKVYAKGSPKSCATDVQNSLDFELRMGYQNLECNVHQSISGRYTNDVILQHHDTIVTSSDLGLAVTCHYDLANKSLSNQVLLDVKDDFEEPALSEEVIVESPNVIMKITANIGNDIMRTAEVGDPLTLKFEILDAQSPYEIFIRELVAMDGNDNAEITLIDSRGCPTDQFIMGPIQKSPLSGKILLSQFEAFKFPTSELVQFRALVTPCMPTCEPIQCEQEDIVGQSKSLDSYGRRRRRSLNETATFQGTVQSIRQQNEIPINGNQRLRPRNRRATTNNLALRNSQHNQEDMLLVESIQITDKFSFHQKKQEQTKFTTMVKDEAYKGLFGNDSARGAYCVNAIGLTLSITSILLIELAILTFWAYFYQRRQNRYTTEKLDSEYTFSIQTENSRNGSSIMSKQCENHDKVFDARFGRKF